jgi:hypothetical protein
MKLVRRLISFLGDSPTYGRDRATLISGFSIGTAGLLLNGAVLLLVLPLMLDPDDHDFRMLTENLEFGQLLALILLGGATIFATLLIPLRLSTVFWGPRIGRYFDQVVLSGISPLRFVIGKAASQNLFVGLIVFLLLPYLVLSLTLGGVNVQSFLAGLLLVWLYCMALALVTLWASLYFNELLAALFVIVAASILSALGCIPLPTQPFVMTPLPALLHPVYSSIPELKGEVPARFLPVFVSCTVTLTTVIGMSLFAIHLGPLFGIIRENSTFGEVVRQGDSKRKRWFRLRLHIQRPSEIAFFYENRSGAFRRNEGLIRWGFGFAGLLLLSSAASLTFLHFISIYVAGSGGRWNWWVYEFHVTYLTIHGCGMALAILVFSHARNSTYLRLPFALGWKAQVSRLDTTGFLLFALASTAASIATPYYFELSCAALTGITVFPDLMYVTDGRPIDYARVAVEGSAVISVAGLVIYAFHRLGCLLTWIRSATLAGIGALYFIMVCMLPVFFAMMFLEVPELRDVPLFAEWAPSLAMVSPFTVELHLFNEMGPRFPSDVSTAPFYVVHGVLLALALFEIRRRGRRVRAMYLAEPVREAGR